MLRLRVGPNTDMNFVTIRTYPGISQCARHIQTNRSTREILFAFLAISAIFVLQICGLSPDTSSPNPIHVDPQVCVALSSWRNPSPRTPLAEKDCKEPIQSISNSMRRDDFKNSRLLLGCNAVAPEPMSSDVVRLSKIFQGRACSCSIMEISMTCTIVKLTCTQIRVLHAGS